MYNWIKNYLTDRYQYTLVNNSSSDIKLITCGVPEVSVVGPLLFIIYVNDIANSVPGYDPKLYADDANLFMYSESIMELENKANICLNNLNRTIISRVKIKIIA